MKRKGGKTMKLRAKRLLALAMAGEGAGTQAEIPVSAAEVTVPAGESVSQETDVVGAILVDFTTMDRSYGYQ